MATCSECHSSNLLRDYERGELVCGSCGLIVSEKEAMKMDKPVKGTCALCGDRAVLSDQKFCPDCQTAFENWKAAGKRMAERRVEDIKDEIENLENALDDVRDAFDSLKSEADG